jgi:phage/plasmid-like protein (TIGR03299 family)
MAHNLNEVNGVASMAYTGEVPWHGLGQHVEGEAMTAEQALKMANLDYDLTKEPIFTRYRDTIIPIESQFAVVRLDTQEALGVVGSKYSIIQNKECFNFFDPVVDRGEAVYHTVGALGKGEKVWILAKLPKTVQLLNRPKDVMELYLLLTNSHDGSSTLRAKFTPVRVVCQNTLSAASCGGFEVSIRHTESYEAKLAQAHKVMGMVTKNIPVFEHNVNKLESRKLKLDEMDIFLNNLFAKEEVTEDSTRTKNIKEEIKTLYASGKGNQGESAWDAVNAVTEYVDHHRSVKNDGNLWVASNFGSGVAMREKAFDLAMQLV